MREPVKDPYALKRLQMENASLKESLELEREKCTIARGLLGIHVDAEKKAEEVREEVKTLYKAVEEVMKENNALKDENRNLKEQLSEIGRLKSVIKDYEEQMYILTKGQDWKETVTPSVWKSYRVSAEILCYAVKGYTAKEIIKALYEGGGMTVSSKRVNQVLSVKEDKDLLRIRTVFHLVPDVFKEQGVADRDVWKWFSETRIKKLKLLDKKEAEKRVGAEVLDGMNPDPYVTGEFYDVSGMQNKEQIGV